MSDGALAILFGAVQGLTEFLPVSSSGHLVLLHSIADLRLGDELAFDVALHLGTLLAVGLYFRSDLWRLLQGWGRSLRGDSNPDGRLAWLIAFGTIPAAAAGWWLEDALSVAVRKPDVVALVLMAGGLALWLVDRWAGQRQDLHQLKFWAVLAIGCGQAIALIPGVSRSGATIMVGRLLGLARPAAARFSFLLSIPIILGAGLKQAVDVNFQQIDAIPFLLGTCTAALVGYLAIRWLLGLVQRRSYAAFAWYRIVLGLVAWIYFVR